MSIHSLHTEHALATGGGLLTGGIMGAVLGSLILGPGGLVMGAAAGVAAGGTAGEHIGEAFDEREALAGFAARFDSMPYYVSEMEWEDYEAAYRYGLRQHARFGHLPFGQVRQTLGRSWAKHSGLSHLTWAQAAKAVEHVWQVESLGASYTMPKRANA